MDSLHSESMVPGSNIYHQFVTQKANALLMDEQSMRFFESELNILPELASQACQYVKSILNIFKKAPLVNIQKRKELKAMMYQL